MQIKLGLESAAENSEAFVAVICDILVFYLLAIKYL